MVEILFYRDSRQRLSRVFSSGHVEIPQSSSDEYSLVCAAVSAILQAARLGLEQYVGLPLEVIQRKGHLAMEWPETARGDQRVSAIVETALLAAKQIAQQYPQHLSVVERSSA